MTISNFEFNPFENHGDRAILYVLDLVFHDKVVKASWKQVRRTYRTGETEPTFQSVFTALERTAAAWKHYSNSRFLGDQ